MPFIDHFGIIAPFYDRVFKPEEKELLFDLIGLPVDGSLLDVGGGTGRISQYLNEKVDQVFVVDLSLEMLQQANTKGGLLTTCSHSENLPFQSQLFDRIIMIDALHHVCDQEETAQDLWRVLKDGGRIVIEEPDVRKFGVKILAIAEKLLGMRSRFISPSGISSLFDGQAITRIESLGVISWIIIEKPVSPLEQTS
jgi:demethylmenaquinone methyltransferase/2-methoxy-6-polyprenyl-1,4-benzoquinol methylase